MAGSVNKVILIGNVGKDPEIRTTQEGLKLASFSIATTESRKDKNTGERIDRTEWHRIVVFNEHLAEIVEKYVKKGTKLYLEGQLQTRKWTDAQGIDRYTTEVVLGRFKGELSLLDSRSSFADGSSEEPAGNMLGNMPDGAEDSSQNFINDEVPF